METFLKYINLYTINETTLNSKFMNFDMNKKFVIAIFENNNLTNIYINYEFIEFNSSEVYVFARGNFHSGYYRYLFVNNSSIKTIISELIYDFNYTHIVDLLLTHYDKKNTNGNAIYINSKQYQIYNHINCNTDTINYLKSNN